MITQFILFLTLLLSLFFLAQRIQTRIYNSIFIVTQSIKFSIGVLIVFLLPGTIIHEISHFLVATILRVPTGELGIFPTIEKSGPASNAELRDAGWEVKAGKLYLGETDPFRLSIIGLAPVLIGLSLIYMIGKSFPITSFLFSFTPGESIQPPQGWFAALPIFVIFYLLFTISITMFSSKKDVEGLKFATPIVLLILISLYVAGVRIFFDEPLTGKIKIFLSDLNYYLSLTAITDSLIFLALSGNLYFWQKILKRKVD